LDTQGRESIRGLKSHAPVVAKLCESRGDHVQSDVVDVRLTVPTPAIHTIIAKGGAVVPGGVAHCSGKRKEKGEEEKKKGEKGLNMIRRKYMKSWGQ
jgi:hypothetical protein